MKTRSKTNGYIIRRGVIAAALLSLAGFLAPIAQISAQVRTLTFADRVAYQLAIEEVYWRHRIWPEANADPKPPLDKVMSQAEIEKKVEDYLRNSQALEDYWQRPITPEQLQAEMERIASHTKQPEVLREIFAALGNDPFVIAECLARPVLAERLITEFYAHDERFHGELKRRAEAELRTHRSVSEMKQTLPAAASHSDAGVVSGTYTEMEWIKSGFADPVEAGVPPAQPTRLPQQKPANEKSVAAVKLNSREWDETVQKLAAMFGNGDPIAAGVSPAQPTRLPPQKGMSVAQLKTGVLSPLQEDDAHYYAVAVMKKGKDRLKLATIAWVKKPLRSWLTKAEAQVPTTMAAVTANYMLPAISSPSVACTDNTWTATDYAPSKRVSHTAVWTGSEMIIWGGGDTNLSQSLLNTGGRYNPSTDTWTPTSTTNAPAARGNHTAVWTGSQMIIWGGEDNVANNLNTGGRYNPGTDSWTATNITNAPAGRIHHTAVWTGSQMIVWGGDLDGGDLNTGGRYTPSSNTWTATSTTNAPSARIYHTAVWTGSEMIVWGGDGYSYLNTGGRYNPSTNTWTATSTTNAPEARGSHTAVWTGSEMIVWGGDFYTGSYHYLNTGRRYNPSTDTWAATSTTNAPEARSGHTAVWTGSKMIIWGGWDGTSYFNTGEKYNPGTDSWTATNTTNAPSGRYDHTAVWTGSEMIVWGGGYPACHGCAAVDLDTGGRYNPNTDTWTATDYSPSPRFSHTAVWTGSEMIVWGGDPTANTGGRYNPTTDTWNATSTTNAPEARYSHTAVWTGTQMIIWGGDAGGPYLNTGGRYNPNTDTWAATSTTNAPEHRTLHTAVWTGAQMIVWGGYAGSPNYYVNTGGRYDPGTNTWTATSTTNAPAGREGHAAVWTGSEMIVWGGDPFNTFYPGSGGRYNPSTNTWTATSTTNAPEERILHTVVWSGTEMIIWGGFHSGYTNLNSGGRYNPSTDTWTATSTTNAPSARTDHTAVWTGSQMIIWGGQNTSGNRFNTGARYNPGTNSWTATSTTNAPEHRSSHTAVWIGSEMIVWGGETSGNVYPYLNTGGRYCAVAGPTPTPTPAVTTNPATNAASVSVTLNGSLNPRGSTTTVYFQYGLTTSYGSNTPMQMQTGNTVRAISANISGLGASHTYHFRIIAHNPGGTAYGSDRTFTTLSATGPPVVITDPATFIASVSATLNGSVDPHGLTTTVHFEYGTTTSYGHTTANQTKTGNMYQSVAANISGLAASTTYHFRIVATNSAGTVHGSDRTFTTLSATGPPVVITNPASYIASFSARLNGSVDPHGLTTSVHFQYGTTTAYGLTTAPQSKTGNTYQNVIANISGLSASTTYHFRIVATNSGGTRYGSDRTFTTP